jgi:hypothetical protein
MVVFATLRDDILSGGEADARYHTSTEGAMQRTGMPAPYAASRPRLRRCTDEAVRFLGGLSPSSE